MKYKVWLEVETLKGVRPSPPSFELPSIPPAGCRLVLKGEGPTRRFVVISSDPEVTVYEDDSPSVSLRVWEDTDPHYY